MNQSDGQVAIVWVFFIYLQFWKFQRTDSTTVESFLNPIILSHIHFQILQHAVTPLNLGWFKERKKTWMQFESATVEPFLIRTFLYIYFLAFLTLSITCFEVDKKKEKQMQFKFRVSWVPCLPKPTAPQMVGQKTNFKREMFPLTSKRNLCTLS